MKKKLIAVLTAGLLLTGCGSSTDSGTPAGSSSSAVDASSIKTMADIYALNPEDREQGYSDKTFFYVCELDGTFYRAKGTMTDEQFDQLTNLGFEDPDYEKKYREYAGPIVVESFENLSEQIPPQEELDKYVGKTGKDLQDDGFTEGYGYNLYDMEFYLYKGPFCYIVTFEADKEYENTDDFDVWATISPLTVKAVKFNGLGNASGL